MRPFATLVLAAVLAVNCFAQGGSCSPAVQAQIDAAKAAAQLAIDNAASEMSGKYMRISINITYVGNNGGTPPVRGEIWEAIDFYTNPPDPQTPAAPLHIFQFIPSTAPGTRTLGVDVDAFANNNLNYRALLDGAPSSHMLNAYDKFGLGEIADSNAECAAAINRFEEAEDAALLALAAAQEIGDEDDPNGPGKTIWQLGIFKLNAVNNIDAAYIDWLLGGGQ